jgi:hypothetical protein
MVLTFSQADTKYLLFGKAQEGSDFSKAHSF